LYARVPGLEVGLSSSAFAVCFLAGSAMLALWLELRFPRLGPTTVKGTLLHVGGTIIAAQILLPLGVHFLTGSRVLTLVALFILALSALTYSLLAAIWLLKLVSNASRGRFR